MEEDIIVIHHTSDNKEEIKEKIAEVRVSKPVVLVVLSVIAYVIMGLNFLTGIFMNISYFEPDVFRPYNLIHGFAFMIKFMTISVHPLPMILLAVFPLVGIIGLALTSKRGTLGFWMFSLSQLGFLAIPIMIFYKSSHLSMIVISLLHSLIILPAVIAFFTYFYYFKKL